MCLLVWRSNFEKHYSKEQLTPYVLCVRSTLYPVYMHSKPKIRKKQQICLWQRGLLLRDYMFFHIAKHPYTFARGRPHDEFWPIGYKQI